MLDTFKNYTIGASHTKRWGLVSVNDESDLKYGVATHMGQSNAAYDNEVGVIAEVADLGFSFFRDDLFWSLFEAVAGVYTFTPTGDTQSQHLFQGLAAAQSYGLEMMMVCAYGNGAMYGSIADATWRDHFVDAYEAAVQSYVTEGYDPAKLILNCWNEPTGTGGIEFDDDAEADEYALTIAELYTRVKAINSSIRVCGPEMLDGAWGGVLAWQLAMWGVADWSTNLDAYSHHIYMTGSTAAQRKPEWFYHLINLFHTRYLFKNALTDGTSKLPVYINEVGWNTTSFTDATCAKYLPRGLCVLSSLPNVQRICVYELIDSNGETYGLSTSLGNRKTQATAVQHILAHLNLSSKRRYYWSGGSHGNGSHAVKLTTNTGERLVAWTREANLALTITVRTAVAGMLSVQTVGSTTATQALAIGDNAIAITLADTAQVLFADVPITFPEFT